MAKENGNHVDVESESVLPPPAMPQEPWRQMSEAERLQGFNQSLANAQQIFGIVLRLVPDPLGPDNVLVRVQAVPVEKIGPR